jgi:plastocyanin
LFVEVPGSTTRAQPALPAYASGVTVNLTLYGDASRGWGFNATKITTPGPNITVLYGDLLRLSLLSADGAKHDFFIDLNGNKAPDTGEPKSPDFLSSTTPTVWPYPVNLAPGTYKYYCQYHFTTMYGTFTVTTPDRYTLWGDAARGWGFNKTNITAPGPTLVIQTGKNVTLTLYAADSTAHTWGIDFNGDKTIEGSETNSKQFSSPSVSYNFTFNVSQGGNYTYRCAIHPTSMYGPIIILGRQSSSPGPGLGLVPSIMIGTIAVVLVLAAVYQVRAVRARRIREK